MTNTQNHAGRMLTPEEREQLDLEVVKSEKNMRTWLAGESGATPSARLEPEAGELITRTKLLEIAVANEIRYHELLKEFPPGTTCDERYNAHERSELAFFCAAWMEKNDIEQARFIGPFGTLNFKRGDRVRIRAGAIVKSTMPGSPSEGIVTTKSQVVKVHSIYNGYIYEGRVINPKISWAGSGGYWKDVDANFCDPVAEEDSK